MTFSEHILIFSFTYLAAVLLTAIADTAPSLIMKPSLPALSWMKLYDYVTKILLEGEKVISGYSFKQRKDLGNISSVSHLLQNNTPAQRSVPHSHHDVVDWTASGIKCMRWSQMSSCISLP